MRSSLRVGLFIGVIAVVFVGLFIAAGGFELISAPKPVTAQPIVVKHGNSGKYLYDISDLSKREMKRVQFDPSLPAEDNLVLTTLKVVAKDEYGLVIDDSIAPVVETIDEVNFVTFTVGRTKVLFELFRNSSGGIGMADFSQEQLQ